MGRRRKAREEALKILFEYDATKDDINDILNYFWDNFASSKDRKVKEYTRELVQGVVDNQKFIDEKIKQVSKNWNLQRMFLIDKNILRIAIFELFFKKEIPKPVIIDEAIEISKIYGTDSSPKFINGIIDAISKKLNK
jgi:N utilization substance protein B